MKKLILVAVMVLGGCDVVTVPPTQMADAGMPMGDGGPVYEEPVCREANGGTLVVPYCGLLTAVCMRDDGTCLGRNHVACLDEFHPVFCTEGRPVCLGTVLASRCGDE